ncbi:MAG: DUF1524 domain-containing protein, partial [Tissierellia bacterium]|nr:DUF1524 domain-containing protein [Tissierellia bacterium]
AKCIWKTDEFDNPNKNLLKIDSEVATDDDKEEFLSILKSGKTNDGQKSRYAHNFKYFQAKIDEFVNEFAAYLPYLPNRIMRNCILLPIEAESQDTALRIFSTLNDRGLPLSDSDIFKAQFYKMYSGIGKKEEFIKMWKELETSCNEIFETKSGSPMDELFSRYMYYERASMGNKQTTTEALRKFYEKDNYKLLKDEKIFENLIQLCSFWTDVENQDKDRFSDDVLRKLFILNYAPNGMWTYFTSVYFMHNKAEDGSLDHDKFNDFLGKSIAFIWMYAITNPGVNALRGPVYNEMINIVNNRPITFENYKFEIDNIKRDFNNFSFNNQRPITKSMLAWWAFQNPRQELLNIETKFDIDHIFPRNRQNKGEENTLSNEKNLESLGNKCLLEKKINIRASDYRFEDKKKYYKGYINNRNIKKEGTRIAELLDFTDQFDDFLEIDIEERKDRIIDKFIDYLGKYNLIRKN